MTALPAGMEGASGAVKAAAGPERFLLLDGLRGLAAFAVILDHTPANVLGDLVPGRYLAVDFFFVLSGFVLAHAYGKRLEGGWSALSFMRARLIRLYPLYFAGFAIGLALSVMLILRGWDGTPLEEIAVLAVAGLLFLPAPGYFVFGGGSLYPFNSPSWSLFFELVANLVYGLIARLLTWRVLAGLLGVGAIAVWVTVTWGPDRGGGWRWDQFDVGLSRVMYDFFAGVALFRMREHWRMPKLPAVLMAVAFLAIIAMPVAQDWRSEYDAIAGIVLMPVLVAFACEASVSGRVSKLCAGFGALSYGVYVLHVPLLKVLSTAAIMGEVELPPLVIVGLIAVGAGAGAAILNRFYDAPVRRWLNAKLPGGANT